MPMTEAVAGPIRRLFGAGTLNALGEGALLDRFRHGGDPLAFEVLLARHGPMVLGVCRRFLNDAAAVDDAFQATFLVLVRKADSVRGQEALGPWLHGVAYKVASKARRRTRPAAGLPSEPPDIRHDDPEAELIRRESAAVLHEELARLPAIYRDPLVLCYLEGLTHDEAARRLSWPVGTVRGRLARARDKLRDRLSRRGLDPAGVPAVLAFRREIVSPALLKLTNATAARLAAGVSWKAVAPPSIVGLARGVLGMLLWNQVKVPIALAALAGLIGVGAACATKSGADPGPTAKASPAEKSKAGDGDPFGLVEMENLPEGTLPMLGDEDTTELIRAAQRMYDQDRGDISRELADRRAEAEFLAAEVDAIKQGIAKVVGQRLEAETPRYPGSMPDGLSQEQREREQEHREQLRKSRLEFVEYLTVQAEELRHRLRDTMRQSEVARAQVVEIERRSDALKRRPRPAERIEIQPGDRIRVEVLEALPGRQITGERLVLSNGKVSLDFYGDLYVAGLTTDEIKEKVILRLRKFIPDATLGLIEIDPKTSKAKIILPKDSDRVFVEILPE